MVDLDQLSHLSPNVFKDYPVDKFEQQCVSRENNNLLYTVATDNLVYSLEKVEC